MHWGLLGIWVKYNVIVPLFIYLFIPIYLFIYTFFSVTCVVVPSNLHNE